MVVGKEMIDFYGNIKGCAANFRKFHGLFVFHFLRRALVIFTSTSTKSKWETIEKKNKFAGTPNFLLRPYDRERKPVVSLLSSFFKKAPPPPTAPPKRHVMINHWEWPNCSGVAANSTPESIPYHPALQISGHPDYHGTLAFPPYARPVAEAFSGSHQYYYQQPQQHGAVAIGGGWVEEVGMSGSRQARIGLDLGRRTYFSEEDGRIPAVVGGPPATVPRCQAEGCRADLRMAKHYHRRHKVCELHSKAATVVMAGGATQRFCQQCSRFHGLSEFDEGKRSCRKRLADHNRRRRKSQPTSSSSGPDPLSNTISAVAAQPPPRTNIHTTRQNERGKVMMGEHAIPWLRSTPSISDSGLRRKIDAEDVMDTGDDVEMLSNRAQTFLHLHSPSHWYHGSTANHMSEDDGP